MCFRCPRSRVDPADTGCVVLKEAGRSEDIVRGCEEVMKWALLRLGTVNAMLEEGEVLLPRTRELSGSLGSQLVPEVMTFPIGVFIYTEELKVMVA